MRFRSRGHSTPVRGQMTSMIDVVFLLLVFFMLTLKVMPVEGENKANFPPEGKGGEQVLPDLIVKLETDDKGELKMVHLGDRKLGVGEAGIRRLNEEMYDLVRKTPRRLVKELNVTIKADYKLKYKYAVRTLAACSTWKDPKTGRLVNLIEKVGIKVNGRE